MKRNNRDIIVNFLNEQYPNVGCELHYSKPYELVIAVMLSAQTTDKAVNKVTEILFARYPSVESLASASFNDVKSIISSIGLADTKARNIISIARMINEIFNGSVVNDKEQLMTLPGVGNKTSEVILLELYQANYFPVDTHVARISKRLRIAKETDNVRQIESKLYKYFDGCIYRKLHHQFIHFGRDICTSKSPKCNRCKLSGICIEKSNIKI